MATVDAEKYTYFLMLGLFAEDNFEVNSFQNIFSFFHTIYFQFGIHEILAVAKYHNKQRSTRINAKQIVEICRKQLDSHFEMP